MNKSNDLSKGDNITHGSETAQSIILEEPAIFRGKFKPMGGPRSVRTTITNFHAEIEKAWERDTGNKGLPEDISQHIIQTVNVYYRCVQAVIKIET